MLKVLKRLGETRRALLVVAAGLLLAAIAFPVWQITLGAPQYPEGPLVVEMYLYPALSGDYEEVNALNSYVGFYYPDPVWIEPDFPIHEHSLKAPEWIVAPLVFVVLALLNLFVAIAPSTRKLKLGLKSLFAGTAVVFVTTLVLVQTRLYQAGHNLDPNAPLRGVDAFTPPLFGSYEVANIDGVASLGMGGYLTVVAVGCLAVAVLLRNTDLPLIGVPKAMWKGAKTVVGTLAKRWSSRKRKGQSGHVEVGFLAVALVAGLFVVGAPLAVDSPQQDDVVEQFDLDIERKMDPPAIADQARATVGEVTYDTASEALAAASPQDTVVLEGTFEERIVVDTPNLRVEAGDGGAVIDGGGEGRVVTIDADDVIVEGLWIRESGYEVSGEDAGVFVDGENVQLRDLYITDVTFGVWLDGVSGVTIADSRIEGRRDVWPLVDRGNGIHLWQADGTHIKNNEITAVRDGIYFSWSDHVVAEANTIWNTRYGVHYMYSSDNRLSENTAVDNDVGYALMVSDRLRIENNLAVRNAGQSGHGILVKDIRESEIVGNEVVENHNGFFVYNSQDNRIDDNLVLRNRVGVHTTAGSVDQSFVGNSFIGNDEVVMTTAGELEVWTGEDGGNYWWNARTIDLNADGTSEVRHRPSGLVEHLLVETPSAAVFANSPAFDAVRLAESSFPILESRGVVDERPLVEPIHQDWRNYAVAR